MKIDNSQIKAIFEFTPADYILVHADHRNVMKEWALCHSIDRSEKGKSPDMGLVEIYVSEEDAEVLKKVGFTYSEL